MQASLADSPFAVLTVVVAPAILTNACSVLALSTSNRLARVVDRTRFVTELLKNAEPDSRVYQSNRQQIDLLRMRAQLLVKALRILYAGLGMFAAAALITVLGSVAVSFRSGAAFRTAALAAFVAGVAATGCLVYGSSLMVAETQVALRQIAGEVEAVVRDDASY